MRSLFRILARLGTGGRDGSLHLASPWFVAVPRPGRDGDGRRRGFADSHTPDPGVGRAVGAKAHDRDPAAALLKVSRRVQVLVTEPVRPVAVPGQPTVYEEVEPLTVTLPFRIRNTLHLEPDGTDWR